MASTMDDLVKLVKNSDVQHLSGKVGVYQYYSCLEDKVKKEWHCVKGEFDVSYSDVNPWRISTCRHLMTTDQETILQRKYPDKKLVFHRDVERLKN